MTAKVANDWQQRVRDEHREVSGRIERLEKFMQGESYKAVSATESSRLRLQLNLMRSYRNVLYERINHDFR